MAAKKKRKNYQESRRPRAADGAAPLVGKPSSPRFPWWLGGTALILVTAGVVIYVSTSNTNGQTPARELVRRRSLILTTLRDTRELSDERRSNLFAARTLRDLEAVYAKIRAEQLRGVPVNGPRAMQYLKQIVAFGPRPSGSKAMVAQRKWLVEHFEKLGGKVSTPSFAVRHPRTRGGDRVEMKNIVVEWHPERKTRILLCAHYDTRPYPDEERNPRKRRGVFVGANDGGSGSALLCELAHHMKDLKGTIGVDFVLFDAEEFVFDKDRDKYFLGSTEFARSYRGNPPAHTYRYGILLDMIGDAQLQIKRESNSMKYARPVVDGIWRTAQRLGIREFKNGRGYEIRDDHLPLNEIARIPTCDLIDFDYPHPNSNRQNKYWHTEQDTVDKCSDVSLARVGWVVLSWIQSLQ